MTSKFQRLRDGYHINRLVALVLVWLGLLGLHLMLPEYLMVWLSDDTHEILFSRAVGGHMSAASIIFSLAASGIIYTRIAYEASDNSLLIRFLVAMCAVMLCTATALIGIPFIFACYFGVKMYFLSYDFLLILSIIVFAAFYLNNLTPGTVIAYIIVSVLSLMPVAVAVHQYT